VSNIVKRVSLGDSRRMTGPDREFLIRKTIGDPKVVPLPSAYGCYNYRYDSKARRLRAIICIDTAELHKRAPFVGNYYVYTRGSDEHAYRARQQVF